jgi:hypothetical protein
MDAWVWIVIAVAAIVSLAAIVLWSERRRRQRRELREWFGPEYDRSVESAKSRRTAEGELAGRTERRQELKIRPLTEGARDGNAAQWNEL